MKISELLRLAAGELVFDATKPAIRPVRSRQVFACHAIHTAAHVHGGMADYREAKIYFSRMMHPIDLSWKVHLHDLGAWLHCPELGVREQQSLRCMALLFAAEAAESEGL